MARNSFNPVRYINPITKLTDRARDLVSRRIVTAQEAMGEDNTLRLAWLNRRPNRLEVFRLIGRYYSEEDAAELLREVERHAWLRAEAAGRDVWTDIDPENPRRAAMFDWYCRYFREWEEARTRPKAA